MEKIGTDYKQRRLQNSRFRKAGSAVSVILECEAREPHTPASLAVFSLVPAFRSNVVRRSRSQKNTAVLQSTNNAIEKFRLNFTNSLTRDAGAGADAL